MTFYSDSTHVYLHSCVTGRLTGFRSDFIEVLHTQVPEKYSDSTTRKAIMIDEGIVAYILKEDHGELCTLNTHMEHAPSSKFRLMDSQWL